MRRRLMQSVAFELLTEGGPWVQVADTGSIRRVNFDLYEISSRNPAERLFQKGVRGSGAGQVLARCS